MRHILVPTLVLIAAAPALASSPAAMARGERDATRACLKASGLRDAASFGRPLMFSDTVRQTALLIGGRYPQKHMKGAKAKMICLYDRRKHSAEVQEAEGWTLR